MLVRYMYVDTCVYNIWLYQNIPILTMPVQECQRVINQVIILVYFGAPFWCPNSPTNSEFIP